MKKRASLLEKISYGFGGASCTAEMTVVNSFLLLFYTDVMGVSPAAIGSLFLIGKVFDAITDLVITNLADNTNSRFGRYRPWLLMSVPLGISFILMLWNPGFLHTNMQKIIWCYVLYILTIPIFETSYMCPLMVLSATMSHNEEDRVHFVASRTLGETVGDLIVASLVMPIVLYFGTSHRDTAGWRVMALIMGAVVIVFGLIAFAGTRERVIDDTHDENGERLTFWRKLGALKGNSLFWKMFVLQFGFILQWMFSLMLFSYFCINCLGREEWVHPLMVIYTLCQIGVTALIPALTKRFGKRMLLCTGCVVTLVSCGLFFVIRSFALAVLVQVLRGGAAGLLTPTIWNAWPDVCDYTEWKTGRGTPGIIMAVANFDNKLGIGIGSYLATLALTLVGYNETALVQTASVISGIRISMALYPLIGVAMVLIATGLMKELNVKNMTKVHADLAISRGEKEEMANA